MRKIDIPFYPNPLQMFDGEGSDMDEEEEEMDDMELELMGDGDSEGTVELLIRKL